MTKQQCVFLALADMMTAATLKYDESVTPEVKADWIDGLAETYDQVHERLKTSATGRTAP